MKLLLAVMGAVALSALPARCVETQTWTQWEADEFLKGKRKGLSVRSDGRVRLAPEFRELFDANCPYLWALAADSRGNIYAGGGGPGGEKPKLWRIDASGKATVYAELEGMEIHALAIDGQDRLYAATAPDGKVYRVTNGKAEVFYDPKAKYIWSLAVDREGNLYVGLGDKGEVHKVNPQGAGGVFFQTEETHARSLAFDGAGNLIVGTEPSGLIFRVTPKGEGFVLYQAPKKEITALAAAPDGTIYAAGVGNRDPRGRVTPLTPAAPLETTPAPAPASQQGGQAGAAATPQQAQPRLVALPPRPAVTGGSDLYQINKEGYTRTIWSHKEDIIYSLAFDSDGKPLVGTGNEGNVYRADSMSLYTHLLSTQPTQVTALLRLADNRIIAATGNVGKVIQIGPGLEKEGTLESDVFDAKRFSYWGRVRLEGDLRQGQIQLEARSGNLDRPQQSWSPWAPAGGEGGAAGPPPARFFQWKATLRAAAGGSPELRAVHVPYLERNVAPVITQLEITPANYQFPPQTLRSTPPDTITLRPLGQKAPSRPRPQLSAPSSQTMRYAKGFAGARWAASDDNDDAMVFRLEIRGEQETTWKLLKDKLEDPFFSFDSALFADGRYLLRVTASDAPSNPAGQALETTLESEPFLIDNTPPVISGLTVTRSGNRLSASWRAADAAGLIAKAEYSLDGAEWKIIQPLNRLTDAGQLDYRLEIPDVGPGERTLAVRVADEYDNVAVEKVVSAR